MVHGGLWYKIRYAFDVSCSIGQSVLISVKLLFAGNVSVKEVSGPIGIVSTVAAAPSIFDFLYLISFISINLGVMNLVPLPALDGGQTVMTIIEGATRKKFSKKILAYINATTLGTLLLIMAAVSVSDVIKLF